MAFELSELLLADPFALAVAVLADLTIGDPSYRWHPVRLIGGTLTSVESALRRIGVIGYGGGIALCLILVTFWISVVSGLVIGGGILSGTAALILHVFILYSLLALGDLLRHVWRIESALMRRDLAAARVAIGHLVGRDTAPMDAAACRRAAVESLSENLTDGFTSPLFWYAVTGLPGLVIFKVVSTMDSMVGYKTPQYLQFGWCGARLDDVMNYLPARMTWVLLSVVAAALPGCSGRKALILGLRQHAVLPGPNSGWSEAATAGGIERRLVGPIWMNGRLVTETWIGDSTDPPLETHDEVSRAVVLVTSTGLTAAAIAVAVLVSLR